MPLHIPIIGAGVVAAGVAYVKAHALSITFSAAKAAAMALLKGESADKAKKAAMARGAVEAAADLVVDFFRMKF